MRFLSPFSLLVGLAAAAPVSGQAGRAALHRGAFAITHVGVVPMVTDAILTDATVLVRDGRIIAVGPAASTRVPNGIPVIDGRGKFLIPGLADMHVHLFSDGEAPDSVAPYELGAMVANGITASRLMMGTPEQLALRREVAAGRVIGPALWLASPEFAGRRYGEEFQGKAIPTAEAARAAVREVADAGYDFIKITLFVGREAYDALVDEARRRRIPVVGHVDAAVGVPHALASGQHIEHLDNYLENVLTDAAPMKASVSDRGVYRPEAWKASTMSMTLRSIGSPRLTARSGTYTTPTLTIFKNAFALGISEASARAWPDWRMYPPDLRSMWVAGIARYWSSPPTESRRLRWVTARNRLVKSITDSGGRVMTGSDTPEFLHSYGWTLHRELESLVTAGLTPFQALTAATRTPARFVGAAAEWGTIEPGKRADLVLLGANPLDDIRNTTRIEGVSLGGRWLGPGDLARMIGDAMARLSGERP